MTDKRPPMVQYIHDFIKRVVEPLGLDDWQIRLINEEPDTEPECRASCAANPEYKTAVLRFHIDSLETGDELDEIIVHELAHCHTWAPHTLAEDNAKALAGTAPEYLKAPLEVKLLEEARIAGEDATTQVGFTYIRLLRRLWKAQEDLKQARAEIKALKKSNKD